MKKLKICSRMICMVLALVLVCAPALEADAAKAVKVSGKTNYTTSSQYTVLKGKTSSGKVVWTYKSKKANATELKSFSYKVKGNYVYCIDVNKYIRINKSTGKVVAKKTLSKSIYGATMYVDSNKNTYAIGYYGDKLYKFNSKGKLVWSKKVPSDYYWAYKIKKSGSCVVVTFDGEPNPGKTLKFKMSTGKIVK